MTNVTHVTMLSCGETLISLSFKAQVTKRGRVGALQPYTSPNNLSVVDVRIGDILNVYRLVIHQWFIVSHGCCNDNCLLGEAHLTLLM